MKGRAAVLALAAAVAGCQSIAPTLPQIPTPIPAPAAPAAPPAVSAPAAPAAPQVRFTPDDAALLVVVKDQDWMAMWPAFLASCVPLTAPRHPHRAQWEAPCAQARALKPRDGAQVQEFFARAMDVYRVSATGAGTGVEDQGLVTGYYEPELRGSRRPGDRYRAPLYRVPVPLPTAPRAELLASGALQGAELLWLEDAVEAFFVEVQGSGQVLLEDGSRVRVVYAGTNGQPYRSIGRWLADQGELAPGDVSMASIRDWARRHPERQRALFEQNPRVVFFREQALADPRSGPTGSLGVALLPGYSVAVDPRFLPLGAPLIIATTEPSLSANPPPLVRAVVAQDTGGAIHGPLRVDWFWGTGPEAGERAGRQKAAGSVRLLVPRGSDPRQLL